MCKTFYPNMPTIIENLKKICTKILINTLSKVFAITIRSICCQIFTSTSFFQVIWIFFSFSFDVKSIFVIVIKGLLVDACRKGCLFRQKLSARFLFFFMVCLPAIYGAAIHNTADNNHTPKK